MGSAAKAQIVPGVHTIDSLGMGRAYLAIDADRVTTVDSLRNRGH